MRRGVHFWQVNAAKSRTIPRPLWRAAIAAIFLTVSLQAVVRCEASSDGSPGRSAGGDSLSVLRVEDDLMVRWSCQPFQKTVLLTLDGGAEWKAMDEAYATDPETQYYCVPRELQKGFFRTGSEELQEFPRLRIMMPGRFISGLPTPIRVEVLRGDGCVDWEVWEGEIALAISPAHACSPAGPLVVHNGIASSLLSFSGSGKGSIRAEFGGESAVKDIEWLEVLGEASVAGELADAVTVWKPGDGVIHVTDDVTIPPGRLLRIYPDTIVLLDPKKSISVRGAIESLGTVEHPVLFAAADPDNPWGEISHAHTSSKSTYRGTFFIGGGDSPAAGHTDRGPVIRVSHAEIEFVHCNVVDNYGKGLYSSHGNLTFTHCLFSRSAMGMEVVDTNIAVDRCFFLEMPMGGDVGDNDPLYLHGGGDMSVTNSIFAIGGDDGIDTLSSQPVIENCIVHGFLDKGITVYYGTTRIRNCLITSNDYGISAKGDGTNVYADRTTVVGNRCTLQSRDKYNVPDAVIKFYVTNSIFWGTEREIQTDYPLEHISITYSVVQGAEPFPGEGNITDDPLFVDPEHNNFRLDENSPCRGTGQDGVDMGVAYEDLP